MRWLSYLLFALTLVMTGIAVFLYLLTGLGCAYALRTTTCRTKFPWELNGEDFLFLFALPWGIVALLLFGAIGLWRRSRR